MFATAIIAGTMAVKKTADLIPFCHPLPIEKCNIEVRVRHYSLHQLLAFMFLLGFAVQVLPTGRAGEYAVTCEVGTFYHTGVEMEALTGCSVAALAVYDMCKALSHDIVISDTRLLSKTGGKSDISVKK